MTHHIRDTLGRAPMRPLLVNVATILVLGCQPDPTSTNFFDPVGVRLSESGLSLVAGDQHRLHGWTVDWRGRAGAGSVDWSSADLTIATVGPKDGLVTAISPGNTTVTATFGMLSATATVSVRPGPTPVTVLISPSELNLVVGNVDRLTATAFDSVGRPTSASFKWSSADPTIATIGQTDGVVTAITNGITTVTAAAGALSATAVVSVVTSAYSFAFTRTSSDGHGSYTSDVLSFSNGNIEALQRTTQFGSIGTPAWSADGLQLAVEVIHGFVDNGEWFEYNSDLYVVAAPAAVGSAWRALTTNGLSSSPTWSPDGRRIAYVEKTTLFGYSDIRVTDVQGGTPVSLSLPLGWYGKPCWSPDGTRLAFSGFLAGAANSVVFVVNADGSGLKALTTPSSDFDPCWSPDGTKLVFSRLRSEPSGAFFSDLTTSDPVGGVFSRLFSSTTFISTPVWSPDGRQIMFSSGGAVYAINADGLSLVKLTTPPPNSSDSAPVWRR